MKEPKITIINELIKLAGNEEVTYLKFQDHYLWVSDHTVANDMKGFTDYILLQKLRCHSKVNPIWIYWW